MLICIYAVVAILWGIFKWPKPAIYIHIQITGNFVDCYLTGPPFGWAINFLILTRVCVPASSQVLLKWYFLF